MKRFMPVFLFLAVLALPSHAQVRWGARAGVVDGEAMVGADLIKKLAEHVYLNPGIELSGYGLTANADVHYDFELMRDAVFWLGAGAALVIPDGHDLDVGVNLIAGVGRRNGRYIFYTQLKKTTPVDADGFTTLAVGVRF